MKYLIYIFFLCNFGWALEQQSCSSCHLNEKQEIKYFMKSEHDFLNFRPKSRSCTECHVNLIKVAEVKKKINFTSPFSDESINKLSEHNSYNQIPSLSNFSKFTNCGLRNFLKRPFPRRFNAYQSMFPMLEDDINELLNKSKLENCAKSLTGSFEKGKVLYEQNGCVKCHSNNNAGPRLRVGYQLLNRKYFEKRLTTNTTSLYSIWIEVKNNKLSKSQSKSIMPIFKFNKIDMDSLYKYISESKDDLDQLPMNKSASNKLYGVALFKEVKKNVFQQSCQHCHSNSSEQNDDNKYLFNFSKGGSSLFDLTDIDSNKNNQKKLEQILSPGPSCADSKMVKLLKERQNEWVGKKVIAERGMPLTQKPIEMKYIEQLNDWTKQGCPTGKKFLCNPCQQK